MTDYLPEFYASYEKYLNEPTVKSSHAWVIQIASMNCHFESVLDLGCGVHNEFLRLSHGILSYHGIDLNARSPHIQADYRTFDFKTFKPQVTAFISLFSSELTAPYEENYKLYERVFAEIPSVQSALVAGAYYSDKQDQKIVDEPGGIRSYQTLEPLEAVESSVFVESRIVMPVPSQMFGPNVIEVWKFLRRRKELPKCVGCRKEYRSINLTDGYCPDCCLAIESSEASEQYQWIQGNMFEGR